MIVILCHLERKNYKVLRFNVVNSFYVEIVPPNLYIDNVEITSEPCINLGSLPEEKIT